MPFEPLCVTVPGHDLDRELYPAVNERGEPKRESGDTNLITWHATGLSSCHGAIGNSENHPGIDPVVYLTDARIAVVARHRVKTQRAFLVGQMRLPWIGHVVYSRRRDRRGENTVRICGTHLTALGDEESVMLIIHLNTHDDPYALAAAIASKAITDRLEWSETTEEQRAALKTAGFTDPRNVEPGTLPSIRLPGNLVVSDGGAAAAS